MSLRTLMQAGPAKANELFAKLLETSDGAVKTKEKLFAELKAELELHASLEEQHLFPILKRNAETKELVGDAIKDNKELRAKLGELDALPKNDENFSVRLKELQKTFRQHARDEKRELLPTVQRALSEEQMQGVVEKIEAGVAEAELAKHEETEERRAKLRQEREQAERQAAQREAAERAQKAAADEANREAAEQQRAKARQQRELAEVQAAQEAAARRAQDEAKQRAREVTQTVAAMATAAQTSSLHVVENAATGAQRVGTEIRGVTGAYAEAMKTLAPDLRAAAGLPSAAVAAMTEMRSAWMEWMGQSTRAGAHMSQQIMHNTVEQQRRFAADVMQGWIKHNACVLQIGKRLAQESFRPFSSHSTDSTYKH